MYICLRVLSKPRVERKYKIIDTTDKAIEVLDGSTLSKLGENVNIIGLTYNKNSADKHDIVEELYDWSYENGFETYVLNAFVSLSGQYLIVKGQDTSTRTWLVKSSGKLKEVYVDSIHHLFLRDKDACWWHCMRAVAGGDSFMNLETGMILR